MMQGVRNPRVSLVSVTQQFNTRLDASMGGVLKLLLSLPKVRAGDNLERTRDKSLPP